MEVFLPSHFLWAIFGALLGGMIFSLVGMIPGTSETATMAPVILVFVLLGFPPAACFTFCIAGIVAKHIVHSVATALLGIPGDTMAVPLLEPAGVLRRLGVPHIALQKMISGGLVGALIGLPISVAFATLLAPFADIVKSWAGPLFAMTAFGIAYFSAGKWSSILLVLPFAIVIQGLSHMSMLSTGKGIVVCAFMGIAIGPMFGDLITALSPLARHSLQKDKPTEFWIAPESKNWRGFIPNPFRILSFKQKKYITAITAVSALTFTFSPVGATIVAGEMIGKRIKGLYEKLTTQCAAMNAATESTYLAEIVIPLIAFGVPLSPIAMGVGFALFNAPPVYTVQPMHNLHTLLTIPEFLVYGVLSVIVAGIIAYPLVMNYARSASIFVMRYISQEAILSLFAALIVVLAYYEARAIGVLIACSIGILGGVLNKYFGFNIGAQFMSFYASSWLMWVLFGVK